MQWVWFDCVKILSPTLISSLDWAIFKHLLNLCAKGSLPPCFDHRGCAVTIIISIVGISFLVIIVGTSFVVIIIIIITIIILSIIIINIIIIIRISIIINIIFILGSLIIYMIPAISIDHEYTCHISQASHQHVFRAQELLTSLSMAVAFSESRTLFVAWFSENAGGC